MAQYEDEVRYQRGLSCRWAYELVVQQLLQPYSGGMLDTWV